LEFAFGNVGEQRYGESDSVRQMNSYRLASSAETAGVVLNLRIISTAFSKVSGSKPGMEKYTWRG